MTIVPFSKLH